MLVQVFFLLLSVARQCSCGEVMNAPSLFVNHGGGPGPVLGIPGNEDIAVSLKNVSKIVDLQRLKAIIVVTAHREEDLVTISSGKSHELYFDYYNFPPESYKFKYPAPGSPEIAREIQTAFENAGIPSKLDEKRGWDHGVFIPMMLINPNADIPVIQVSILKNQDAKQHFEMGKVLYRFREKGIGIFGSGMSYHNMKELRKADANGPGPTVNDGFDDFLNDACLGKVESILDWEKVPGALDAHPKGEADHLMPLIVNAGAAGGSAGRRVFNSNLYNKFRLSGFIWE